MQQWIRYGLNAFLVVATPLIVFGLIFQVLLFTPLYWYPAYLAGTSELDVAPQIHNELILYYLNPFSSTFPELGFAEDEVSHLQDVKWLIWKGMLAYYLLLLSFWYVIRLRANDKSAWQSIFSGLVLPIIPTAGMAGIIIFFEHIFRWLHPFFFEAGTWTFAEDSFILQMYPIGFFLGFTITLFVLTTITSVILLVLLPEIKQKFKRVGPHFSSNSSS